MKNIKSKSIAWCGLMAVAVTGVFYSHYITGLVLQGSSAIAAACSGNGFFDCGKTLGSSYGKVFGIPVSFFATLYFGWMIYHLLSNSLWSEGNNGQLSAKDCRRLFGLPYRVSLLAAGVCLVMAGISFFVLHAVCLYCLTLDGLVALALGLSYWGIRVNFKGRVEHPCSTEPQRTIRDDRPYQMICELKRDLTSYGLHWYQRNWRRHSALVMLILFSAEMIIPSHLLWAMRSPLDLSPVVLARDATQRQLHIVEFTDFECPACQYGAVQLEKLKEKYPGQVEIEVVNFPLSNKYNPSISSDLHPLAGLAAKVGIVMKGKGKFEDYYKKMMLQNEQLTEGKIDRVLKQLNEDMATVKKQAESSEVAQILAGDIEKGRALGVHATPTLIVNGEKLTNGVNVAKLESMIFGTEAVKTVVDNAMESIRVASLLSPSKSVMTLASAGSDPIVAAAGTTINAASCSLADVQAAVNAAANGDTVIVPAGTCTWNSSLSWVNKNVTVKGAGMDNTIINCAPCLQYESTATTSVYSQWRLTGMTFKAAVDSRILVTIWDMSPAVVPNRGWRIDHMKFVNTGHGDGIFIGGPTYGVIDHNQWESGGGLCIIALSLHANEYPSTVDNPKGAFLASQPLDLGTENALYIEDNTFTGTSSVYSTAAYDTSSGGARAVFRHNTLIGSLYYSHWTRGAEIGGILHEIYNNSFTGTANYNGLPIRLESGTGVIFNNTISGFSGSQSVTVNERRGFGENQEPFGACDGTKSWDGNAGDPNAPGWPCLGQIGRSPGKTMAQIKAGDKQASAPLYLWNNGTQDGCHTGGTCTNSINVWVYDGTAQAMAYVKSTPHPNGEVDYVLNGSTPKPGYTPYTYPHPLTQSTGNILTVKKDGTGDFTTIQACADVAKAGETCLVYPGTYAEHVKTKLSGSGESDRITFKANGTVTMQGFDIKHPYVTIEGFNITGYTATYQSLINIFAGGDYCRIINNMLVDNAAANVYGIYFYPSGVVASNCVISGNTIRNIRGNFLTTGGNNNLFEYNTFSMNNSRDFIRLFGNGHIFRRNIFKNGTVDSGSGNHPDFVQTFGGPGIEAQNMLFEENWIEDLVEPTQFSQTNSADGSVFAGILYDNVKNFTFRRNVIISMFSNANNGMPGVTYENNTFYRMAYGASGLGFGGGVTRGDAKNATIKNNVFAASGSGSNSSGFYNMSGQILTREGLAVKVTGEACTGAICSATGLPANPNGPIATGILNDLTAKGYTNSNGILLQPGRDLTSITQFNLDGAYLTYKQAIYDLLILTRDMDVVTRNTFYANYNYVGGPAPTYAAKRNTECPLGGSTKALSTQTYQGSTIFCEPNGINGGNPSLASLIDFDGPDNIPFTLDDGLKPLSSSILCGRGAGGTDIGAYSCDPNKVFADSPDSDGDGLLDTWEIQHFGSISDPRAQPGLDPDNDGFTNLEEQTTGTSPIDSKSALRITSVSLIENIGLTITWQSVSNKTYTVQSASNVGSWTNTASVSSSSSSTSWIDASPSATKKFYRVKLP
jgi:protein-disulfide isomerase/uncharacterized membrane protein